MTFNPDTDPTPHSEGEVNMSTIKRYRKRPVTIDAEIAGAIK